MSEQLCIYVRRLSDREIVSTVPWERLNLNERTIELVVRGMMRNLHEDYYVDASEVEDACRALVEGRA